jgi:transcriptional regulator with XRE-family HTH domain
VPNSQNTKIIFGLKVKQLRKEQNLSFQDLKELSGLSVSYLNEIEKGKKYPRADKIEALATALKTTYDELTSQKLSKNLLPLSNLLDSNILHELPFDLFGIDAAKVVEIIANAPTKVGAFISALMEISSKYELQQENFYFAALRSYQELHENYFEELEEQVDKFVAEFRISTNGNVSFDSLARILQKKYRYKIDTDAFRNEPELQIMRSISIPNKKKLLVNYELTDTQRAFQMGKELAFNYLKLKDRIHTSSFLKVGSFDQVLNNFKAAYFSVALLINRDSLVNDLRQFFKLNRWNSTALFAILDKYQASPEMFLHRMAGVLPKFFGIDDLFFLRVNTEIGSDKFYISKELHLNQRQRPHGNEIEEHYCRRWVSLWLLNDLKKLQDAGRYQKPLINVQRSKYFGTDDEYFCITIARPGHPTPNTNISVTLGLLINDKLKETIRFWEDDNIPVKWVNNTCERCSVEDCEERSRPPIIVERLEKQDNLQNLVNNIFEG